MEKKHIMEAVKLMADDGTEMAIVSLARGRRAVTFNPQTDSVWIMGDEEPGDAGTLVIEGALTYFIPCPDVVMIYA